MAQERLRAALDSGEPGALAALITEHPDLATTDIGQWPDHPMGASPLGYVAMARFDTLTRTWRDVAGAPAMAQVLIAAGAPVDGAPGAAETPLITAASYGDAGVAAVLIAAGADVDATASTDSGGVPGGSALLHAAVFGMTDVVDVRSQRGLESARSKRQLRPATSPGGSRLTLRSRTVSGL